MFLNSVILKLIIFIDFIYKQEKYFCFLFLYVYIKQILHLLLQVFQHYKIFIYQFLIDELFNKKY